MIRGRACADHIHRRATAIKLHQLGAKLAITDVSETGAQGTADLCGGDPHIWRKMDVSDSEDVERQVGDIASHFGKIDHVFNCAGVNPTSTPLTETSEAYYDKLMGVNLKGMFLVTKATIPHITTPGGTYVNVSSISGLHATAGTAVYCATKFGVIGFSKSMALELGPRGVRVNVVAPGYIDTPTNAGIAKGTVEARARMEKGNSLGRMGMPQDIADVSLFLDSCLQILCRGGSSSALNAHLRSLNGTSWLMSHLSGDCIHDE